ncbi:MAG: hypothetical protein MI739_03820 [Bacteroidales bacterium]|nr:hypothetical protein [Bacteroidales bacterium]
MMRFILILLFIFILLRFFAKYFLRSFMRNVQQNYNNQQSGYSQQKKEGDITIKSKSANKSKKIKKDEGDYVDFEEM